jgi:hypothetical protein
MAIGDHRYSQGRWRSVLVRILLSRERRIRLLRNPEHAAEVWGFCPAGRGFLRIVNALAARHGEEAIQGCVDRFLAILQQRPESVMPLFGACAVSMRDPRAAALLEQIAQHLGYVAPKQVR